MQGFTFFGVAITLTAYEIGVIIKRKWKLAIFNPLLIAIILIICFLSVFHIDYEVYQDGSQYFTYLLTPSTVCLAIPLYQKLELLRKNKAAVLIGIFFGVLASLFSVLMFSLLFGLTHQQYVTMLPKSITTAIGMAISEELGGIVTITVTAIIITGILGNMFAETACRLLHIEEPIAKGVAIGTASHAMGTAKAMEMGEIEGAMSSLAIAVSGLFTVVLAPVFAHFL
jgi:predicted murein hydrolase (TIGR00659 family)